ncbi:hypothetical protein ACOMHN_064402 [Nucella lapillus]
MPQSQKRSAAEAGSLIEGIKAIVFDIEGTVTPISFVKETLFPYARDNLEKYLKDKFEDAETKKDICALRELAKKDKADGKEGVVEIPESSEDKGKVIKGVVANVQWQMDNDRKSTELKQLQGHIWRQGYESGKVKGQLFEDVPPMLRLLKEEGFKLYVYSSGSVESQKLLFGHPSIGGDLTEIFTDFFDTTTGGKTEVESYKKITEKIGKKPAEILFLTDLPEEAETAVTAGWRSALMIRCGNADLTDEHLQNFACIEQLDELYGEDDDDDVKRIHTNDNGEADDDDDEEVDEDEEGEEEEEEEGEDA